MMGRRLLGIATVLSVGLLGGCDWFQDLRPDTIEVNLEGPEGQGLRLITSREFFPTTNEGGDLNVQLALADTTLITFPYRESWDISEQRRFVLQGFLQDSTEFSVRMRISLDGVEELDGNILTTVNRPLQFIYLFNAEVAQDFEVL